MWNLKSSANEWIYNKKEADSQTEQISGCWWGEGGERGTMGEGLDRYKVTYKIVTVQGYTVHRGEKSVLNSTSWGTQSVLNNNSQWSEDYKILNQLCLHLKLIAYYQLPIVKKTLIDILGQEIQSKRWNDSKDS